MRRSESVNGLLDELRLVCRQLGLSRKQLAEKLEINRDTVDTWYSHGSTHAEPSTASIGKIEAFLEELSKQGITTGSFFPMTGGNASPVQGQSKDKIVDSESRDDHVQKGKPVTRKGGELKTIQDKSMLLPYKTITDCIHDDISLTRMETEIVDTPQFQRLRAYKQLGTAYLTYPCAVHTRFEHSLGTLAQAADMVNRINSNPLLDKKVEYEEEILVRLVALLHDIGYAPFGHELEDEASIIPKHENRYEEFLASSRSRIGEIIKKYLNQDYLRELVAILKAKEEEEVNSLQYPYISDIVKNTICADLLDYVKRDNYFTGLKETFGRRFMNYFVVTPIEHQTGKGRSWRLAIRLEKKGILRRDVLSEVIQLLRSRYSLGEKVYYHHTKQVTSAMVSKAVYLSGYYQNLQRLCQLGDEDLLTILQTENSAPGAKQIVDGLRSRQLYKAIYWVTLDSAKHKQHSLVRDLHKDFSKRAEVEREIAEDCSINEEDVIIYCPDSDMSLKEAAVKVMWLDDTTKELSQIHEDPPSGELRELNEKHYALWRFCVLLRGSLVDARGQEISDACFHRWQMVNQNPRFSRVGPDQSLKTLLKFMEEQELTGSQMRELQEIAHLDKSGEVRTVDEWRKLWGKAHS
jgi:HD superfamily phosphohydrolase